MNIDQRKKKLKFLRRTRYDTFEHVCQQLGITYTFPPEYYRRATRRWQAKKALCIKVADAVLYPFSAFSGKHTCSVFNETLNVSMGFEKVCMCHTTAALYFDVSAVAAMQMPCPCCTTVVPQMPLLLSLRLRSSKRCRNRKHKPSRQ